MVYFTGDYKVDGTTSTSLLGALGLVRKILTRNNNTIALDVETQGRKIIMFQIGDAHDQIVIDARTHSPLEIVSHLVDCKATVIGHNIKFDYKMIVWNYGLELHAVRDTMLASQILTTGLKMPKGYHSLQECTRRFVDPFAYTDQGNLFRPTATKSVRDGFASVVGDFSPLQVTYGALDIEYVFRLEQQMRIKLEEAELTAAAELIEYPFCLVAADMELVGVPINQDKWADNADTSACNAETLLKQLNLIAPINWASPKQVLEVFKSMGISPSIVDKETGEVKDSVSALAIGGLKEVPEVLRVYLEYKRVKKLNTGYGMKFLSNVDPQTGRIHTSIFQILNTGRTSSNSPNMQNVPRNPAYRSCFEAPEGRTLILADYSNQEARILADLSQDPVFIEACKNSDIHLATAKLAFDNPNLTKESEERQIAKSMTFLTA